MTLAPGRRPGHLREGAVRARQLDLIRPDLIGRPLPHSTDSVPEPGSRLVAVGSMWHLWAATAVLVSEYDLDVMRTGRRELVAETLGVAEAKRRFSELIERVRRGERFLISRRGTPEVALVPPEQMSDDSETRPAGLAAIAGALADFDELDDVVAEIYRSRRRAWDRPAPELD